MSIITDQLLGESTVFYLCLTIRLLLLTLRELLHQQTFLHLPLLHLQDQKKKCSHGLGTLEHKCSFR